MNKSPDDGPANVLLIRVNISQEFVALVEERLRDLGVSVTRLWVGDINADTSDLENVRGYIADCDLVALLVGESSWDSSERESVGLPLLLRYMSVIGTEKRFVLVQGERDISTDPLNLAALFSTVFTIRGDTPDEASSTANVLHKIFNEPAELDSVGPTGRFELTALKWGPPHVFFELQMTRGAEPDQRFGHSYYGQYASQEAVAVHLKKHTTVELLNALTIGLGVVPPGMKKGGKSGKGAGGTNDEVTCSVFSPPVAAPGDELLVQAYAHLTGREREVAAMAARADSAASLRGSQPVTEPVARGVKLGLHLRMRGVEIDEPDIVLVWRGDVLTAQFGVFIPEDFQQRSVNATIQVTKDGVPIGHVKFTLQVLARNERQRTDDVQKLGTLSRYREAFISYASKDREQVLPMVQALAAAKINVFQDLINLEPGSRWAKELYKHIDNSDVIFLFWSKAAKESEWVMKEILYAHARQGGNEDAPPEIIPIIIEGPPPVKPPPELSFLHFNDKFIYLRKGVEEEARAKNELARSDIS
jgi:TIR domain